MSYSCKILLDSISETGKRITTFEITFPRIVLAEFNTHRMFSRNSASSRAIPFEKQIDRIYNDPFIPEQFPLNCKGMQPQEYITKDSPEYKFASQEWIVARNGAITQARQLRALNVHKQITNRLLEPFQYHTVIVTATEFDNFFKLRTNENAQYEIRRIADLMYNCYHNIHAETCQWTWKLHSVDSLDDLECNCETRVAEIQKLKVGEWHCPLVYEEDDELIADHVLHTYEFKNGEPSTSAIPKIIEARKKISVARCARVSYLTHDGKRDIEKDLELFERLRTSGHWSPFEHVATPFYDDNAFNFYKLNKDKMSEHKANHINRVLNLRSGNFLGWKQFRKEFVDENCTNFRKES